MKKKLILIWLICPVVFIYLHFQWGPRFQFEQAVAQQLKKAESFETKKDWQQAVSQYDKTISFIQASIADDEKKAEEIGGKKAEDDSFDEPAFTSKEILEIRAKIDRAKALTNTKRISNATVILGQLVQQMDGLDYHGELADEARCNLAICQYYVAWHMRIEGMLRSDWLPELESARQIFKYLARKNQLANHEETSLAMQKNLEAVIRLERMDLPTLQAMELPKEGAGKGEAQAGKKFNKQKGKSQGEAKSKGKQKGKSKSQGKGKPKDSRKGGFQEYKLPPGS